MNANLRVIVRTLPKKQRKLVASLIQVRKSSLHRCSKALLVQVLDRYAQSINQSSDDK